jgi:hypothetical protein
MSTPSPVADCNLIFGLLALQMDFVTREQLLDAMAVWMLDKQSPLGEILCQRGALAANDRIAIDGLVERHIARSQPFAAISAGSTISRCKRAWLGCHGRIPRTRGTARQKGPFPSLPRPHRLETQHSPYASGGCASTRKAGWARCSWLSTVNSTARWR